MSVGARLRRRPARHRAGGGGSPTLYDDEFSIGSTIDTTGSRYAGAIPWTTFNTGINFISANVAGGQLTITTSSNGVQTPRGGTMPVPSGDWTFETTCSMATSGFASALGIYAAEASSGKFLLANFCDASGKLVALGNNAGLGTYGNTAVTAMSGKIELARIAGNLRMRYDIGAGWVTLVASLAQTTPFTTAPDTIGLFVQNETGTGGNAGVFDYWRKTA